MKKNIKYIDGFKIDNIMAVFSMIRNYDGITRVAISEKLSLTKMNVTRIVALLIGRDFVYEDGESIPARGRPAIMLHVNPHAAYFFTANIDVDGINVAVLNLKNEIILEKHIDARDLKTMEEYVDSIYNVFLKWQKEHRSIFVKISSVAFSTPGIINPVQGEILISAQLGWEKVKIVDYSSKKFGIKTIIDNDVKSALLGELSLYEKEKHQSIAYMCIGYGVGVGVWIDGKILRGANNNAGEIGHISIDYHGKLCRCGRRGCLDTVLNINSFLENAKISDPEVETISDIIDKYNMKEKWALDLVDDASRYFSIAVNNIVHAYDPDKIILGGKLFKLFPEIRNSMLTSKYFDTYSNFSKRVKIEESQMDESANLIGAAINSQNWLFEKEFSLKSI